MREALYLIPYGLVAAASPLGLAAALTVMRSSRLKALCLAVGTVVGQLISCGCIVALDAVVDHTVRRPHLEAVLELTLGIACLVFAAVIRRRPETTEARQPGRSHRILDRLERVRPGTAVLAGLALGIGGPKRLVVTGLAAASIIASGSSGAQETALVTWYAILATAVVWAPVAAYVLSGQRAVAEVDGAFAWLARHRRSVTFYVSATIGVALLAGGLALLD